ncbi:biogenesis of lysosome-related organelles complex 1 subunit 6 isoform X2 [Erpetoichthys calabaricus]|uniref:biogenesis of lysosome-related organelles complex 1 subunit 6 isoform X2 n=1 Tax=Erpetoichthys calabaricus TaxID=27687 RepID=UPI002233EEE9|nr:biogenesis of lysosome-related organelles complex 1 subunit 6 isoform X2 [Erpetoichthys calabaricus]
MDKEMKDEESSVPAASHRSDTLELPFSEDAVLVDKDVIEKLTEGLVSHYLPDLQHSKLALQELTKNQSVLLDTLDQEIAKFRECNSLLDINALKRALKLQQQKHKEILEQEQQRERELERERQLIAKPAKKT